MTLTTLPLVTLSQRWSQTLLALFSGFRAAPSQPFWPLRLCRQSWSTPMWSFSGTNGARTGDDRIGKRRRDERVWTMRLAALAGAVAGALLSTPVIAAGPPPRPLFLALGDSVAAGVGAQPPATQGVRPGAAPPARSGGAVRRRTGAWVPAGPPQLRRARGDNDNTARRPTPHGCQPHHAAPSHRHPDRRRPTDHARRRRQRRLTVRRPGLQQRPASAPSCATTISTVLGAVNTNFAAVLSGLRAAARPQHHHRP